MTPAEMAAALDRLNADNQRLCRELLHAQYENRDLRSLVRALQASHEELQIAFLRAAAPSQLTVIPFPPTGERPC